MPNEQNVPLQTDTISQIPVPIRTVGVNVPVGVRDVPTNSQQQVVTLADSTGVTIDMINQTLEYQRQTMCELREVRKLLAILVGAPTIFQPLPGFEQEPSVF